MWIFHVTVDRMVISLHLPVGRHRNVVPFRHIEAFLEESYGTKFGFAHQMKLPRAVERKIALTHGHRPRSVVESLVFEHLCFARIRLISGVCRQAIECKDSFIFPPRRFDFRLIHLVKSHPSRGIFEIERHNFHFISAQRKHLLFFVERSNDVSTFLFRNRQDGKLRISGISQRSRPLQQVVYRSIVAPIVKMLHKISIFHHAAIEIEHFHRPVLTAMRRVLRFCQDGATIFSHFSVTQHKTWFVEKTQTIRLLIVKSRNTCRNSAELRLFAFQTSQINELKVSTFVQTDCFVATCCWHKHHTRRRLFDAPQLILIRTIDFSGFHSVTIVAQSLLSKRIKDAPRTRKRSNRPVLLCALCIC